MTREEKLRALLADANEALMCCRGLTNLGDRIDAALAEPVGVEDPMIRLSTAQSFVNAASREGFAVGFRRGAEAMREASLRVCNEASFGWGADDIAEELRALPIPEDKP